LPRDEGALSRPSRGRPGPGRKSSGNLSISLAPDSDSVNEALRFLIRITAKEAARS